MKFLVCPHASTGRDDVSRQTCNADAKRETTKTIMAGKKKMSAVIDTREPKLFNQLSETNHTVGKASTSAITTRIANCPVSKRAIVPWPAPRTFLMLISFRLCDAVSAAKPNNPNAATISANWASTLEKD